MKESRQHLVAGIDSANYSSMFWDGEHTPGMDVLDARDGTDTLMYRTIKQVEATGSAIVSIAKNRVAA